MTHEKSCNSDNNIHSPLIQNNITTNIQDDSLEINSLVQDLDKGE